MLVKFLLANNVDPDQKPHDGASELGLHCLAMALLFAYGPFRGFEVRMC